MTRILVIYPGGFGDTLLSLPALTALARSVEPASLELIGHSALVDFLPGRSVLTAMRSIEGPEFRSLLEEPGAVPAAVGAFFGSFDLAVVWTADPEGVLERTLKTLGIQRVVAQSPGLRAAGRRHATDRFCATILSVALVEEISTVTVTTTREDRRRGEAWLAQSGLCPEEPLIAIHPGSGSPSKCWPAKYYAEIIRTLIEDGFGVLVLEGPADKQVVEALNRNLGSLTLPRLINAPLPAVVGVLAHCRAFLGNDSGMTHLAAAVGCPAVGIFGPTDPALWAPRGKHVISLRGTAGCRCLTPEAQAACFSRDCLAIAPAVVLAALRRTAAAPAPCLARDLPLC